MNIQKNSTYEGVFTALITPFKKGEIDWNSIKGLLRQQIESGVQGLVISGTTGESPTLSLAETKEIFEFVRSESGGSLKLVVGTGSNCTADTIEATRQAQLWGADAALVVVPYYNKPSQAGLYEHFSNVAKKCGLPIILYNVPSRTITKLELSTIKKLAAIPEIVAIKEASGDIEFGEAIAKTTGLLLSSGDDGSCFQLVGVGGRSVISVISHLVPKDFTTWMKRALDGQSQPAGSTVANSVAAEFAKKYGALNSALYVEANPIPVKYALWKMGLIASPELRLPLTALDESHRPQLDKLLKESGLIG
jgi:4-hydroxy-tetrahydrodipicolinate synthase